MQGRAAGGDGVIGDGDLKVSAERGASVASMQTFACKPAEARKAQVVPKPDETIAAGPDASITRASTGGLS